MGPEVWIPGILSLIGIAIGAYATYRATIKGKRIESQATPYTALADRVTALEESDKDKSIRIAALEQQQVVDRAYMKRMIGQWPNGYPLPLPMPEWLELHVENHHGMGFKKE